MSKRLFDSVLLHNAIPVTDLPPCILTEMLNKTDKKLKREWDERTKAQLNAMLSTIPAYTGLPSRDEIVAAVEKRTEIDWNPLDVITRSEEQSDLSYEEQRTCITMGMSAVKKYKRQFGPTTQTKGVFAHGSPGSGKSFVLEAQGLYAMTQGLRVMSTSLMAVRSNALGGYHIHKLFTLEVNKNTNVFRLAELAMDKLDRKSNTEMKHILLTMDVLLLDECGQLSAQQFALLDIILRHIRQNSLPFGGVLIFGTFDHAQLGAIEGLPFLLSSHILTDFNLIRMKHSVRAHSDPDLQEIQNITRMSPSVLKGNVQLKEKFAKLIREHIQFADDWDDKKIGPNTQRMYSKRIKAVKAAEENAKSIIGSLEREGISHIVSHAEDFQQVAGSRVVMVTASDAGLKSALDRKCREPKTLVFFPGALFEATVNGKNYSQSQVLRLINVPTQDEVDSRAPIWMMASPSGNGHYNINTEDSVPTEEELEKQGWSRVQIETGREDQFITHGIYQGKRVQYSVRHLGSSTINKQMGNTILCPVAIEMTEECCPWEKGQVVVMLSRSPRSDLITIVGKRDFAIERMWSILCKSTQWTPLMESILNKLSIEGDGEKILESDVDKGVLELAELYPYKVCDIELPTAESGYVYLLMSVAYPERTYVGQCENLERRIRNHNSGHGSEGTAPAVYLPYAPAAYLTNLGHMDESDRMSLERSWQIMNEYVVREEGMIDIEARIDNGRRLMVRYNESNPVENHIRLIKCMTI
jgi:DNA replication protein DnaC/predicted GIY-YIG superfamily endonuclease